MTEKPAPPLVSPWDLPRRGERTVEERYDDLIAGLKTVEERRKNENIAPLNAAFLALKIVILFLKEHSGHRKNVVSPALLDLAFNIQQHIDGARAPMFRSRNRSAGAPTNTTRGLFRARIVIAIEMLCHAGMKDTEAASFVCQELRRQGVTKFSPKQIRRWSSDKATRMISGFAEAYEVFVRKKSEE
jgi:hypothetical protein